MKRCLPAVPIILLLVLNACGNSTDVPPALGTAVAQTQTATMWTPTITPTPDPDESKIVEWLNQGLMADDLGRAIDASYTAVDVSFPYIPGNSSPIFRVDVRCECVAFTQCCIPERMFVVTISVMAEKNRAQKIIEQVPGNTSQVKIVCFDHLLFISVMVASWPDVKSYLEGSINGYQLGSRVYRGSLP